MRPQILFNNCEVSAWIWKHFPESPPLLGVQGPYWSVGFSRYGKLIGGAVIFGIQENRANAYASIAGYGAWMTKEVAATITTIPFEVFHVAHVTALVREDNLRSIKLMERLGYKIEGYKRKAYDGVRGQLVFGLTAEDNQELLRRFRWAV